MQKDSNKYKLLLIEDNPGDILIIKELVSEKILSPQITVATDFASAERILSSTPVGHDVILLDLTLPDKDGESLVLAILRRAPSIPVIILTGYSNLDFSIQAIAMGVSDYLIKDELTTAILYKSIVYCIERKRNLIRILESEKRYSELFHLSPQPMWVYDPETLRFSRVNKAAVQHYGYSEKEFLNLTILDIRPQEDINGFLGFLKVTDRHEMAYKGRFGHYTATKRLINVEIFSNTIMEDNKPLILVIVNDITEKLAMESNITRAIIKVQEDERYEIGAELHDNIGQLLAALQLKIDTLKRHVSPELLPEITDCKDLLSYTNSEIRNVSHRLAPVFFNDVYLNDALNHLIKILKLEEKYTVLVNFSDTLQDRPIKKELQLNLYRILQEQLKNIIKYSNASTITIELGIWNDQLQMIIVDDGVGFETQQVKNGIGLSNIKRRAELFSGVASIISSPGSGCKVIIAIPLINASMEE